MDSVIEDHFMNDVYFDEDDNLEEGLFSSPEEAIKKLTRDLKKAVTNLSTGEIRYLVDYYYQVQQNRITAASQLRNEENPDKISVISWLYENNRVFESNIKNALKAYSLSTPVGIWLNSIVGIGPVIASGFMAHLDITKAPTSGHFESFAGLNPTVVWEKGSKRPWNADLKVICWKLGESFVKSKSREKDIYGKILQEKKDYYTDLNEQGHYREKALERADKVGKSTDAYAAYSQGKFPKAHIHAMARRFAVKVFLNHLHHVMYLDHYGVVPPKPYAIAILNHAHEIEVPNLDIYHEAKNKQQN